MIKLTVLSLGPEHQACGFEQTQQQANVAQEFRQSFILQSIGQRDMQTLHAKKGPRTESWHGAPSLMEERIRHQGTGGLGESGAHITPDTACKREGAVLVCVHAALVQVTDIDLHAGMVLGCDELVCPRAANIQTVLLKCLKGTSKVSYCSCLGSSPLAGECTDPRYLPHRSAWLLAGCWLIASSACLWSLQRPEARRRLDTVAKVPRIARHSSSTDAKLLRKLS